MKQLTCINNTRKTNYDIKKNIKPERIYIPLEDIQGRSYRCHVTENSYVYKGDVIATRIDNSFPIHSSVSGYVKGFNNKMLGNGKIVTCLCIENDFKERYSKDKILKEDVQNYQKMDFINKLKMSGITNFTKEDIPIYIKYNIPRTKYLVINATIDDLFVSSSKAIIYNYAFDILECIDKILDIMKMQKAFIILKENDTNLILEIEKYLGMYPNIQIRLVKSASTYACDELIVRNAFDIHGKKSLEERGIVVNNLSSILAIWEMLKYDFPLTEKVITVSGPGISKKRNVRVKVGSLAKEVINDIGGYKMIKNPLLIAGNLITGKSLPSDDVVITRDMEAILVIENNFSKSHLCSSCGKCIEVCPSGLFPLLIMKNINSLSKVKKLKPEKCIECGLCSFICPSKIEVREFVKFAKERVGEKENV